MSGRQGGKAKPLKAAKKKTQDFDDEDLAFKAKQKADAAAKKAMADKAKKGGPMVGGGIKKSAKNQLGHEVVSDKKLLRMNKRQVLRMIKFCPIPRKWKKRAMRYQITKPLGVNSSHNMIVVRYLLDLSNGVQVDRPRFQYPLHRMQPPFNEARTWDIPADTNIDEAIELIQGDGYEYISLMGFLRKTDPGMV
ncbi:hypothetical protein OXX69_011607, partial [Metschnikowia pulcherrima]